MYARNEQLALWTVQCNNYALKPKYIFTPDRNDGISERRDLSRPR